MRKWLSFFVLFMVFLGLVNGEGVRGKQADDSNLVKVSYLNRDYSGRGAYVIIEPELGMVLQPRVDGYKVPFGTIADEIYNAKLISGWRFSNYFTLGAGLGFSNKALSAFIDARSYFLKGPITPYFGLQIGVGAGCGTAFIFTPSIGAKFSIANCFAMSAYCGYQPPFAYFGYIPGYGGDNLHIITVGIGCHFDFWKRGKPSSLRIVDNERK